MGYQLDEVLGTGRGGDVYRSGVDRLGAAPVAVRFLDLDDDGLAHLRRHAEALALVGHDGLGLIEDVTRTGDGQVLTATTLGRETLRHRLERGPLDVTDALEVIGSIASALAAAHRSALPHCGVHTGNVVLTDTGPVLVDLGLEAFRTGGFEADTPFHVWRSDRRALVEMARQVVASVEPTATTRAAALIDLVGDRADRFVDDERGLWTLARECERISRRPDVTNTDSCEDFGTGVFTDHARSGQEAQSVSHHHIVAACAVVIGGIVGLTIVTETRPDAGEPVAHREPVACGSDSGPDRAEPADAEPIDGLVDRDGDGCIDDVWWSSADAVLHVAAGDERQRFRLGEPGDQAVVGDWNCDGESTVGLYRPSTGETFRFGGWADHGDPLVASPGPLLGAGGRAEVTDPSTGDCDTITLG